MSTMMLSPAAIARARRAFDRYDDSWCTRLASSRGEELLALGLEVSHGLRLEPSLERAVAVRRGQQGRLELVRVDVAVRLKSIAQHVGLHPTLASTGRAGKDKRPAFLKNVRRCIPDLRLNGSMKTLTTWGRFSINPPSWVSHAGCGRVRAESCSRLGQRANNVDVALYLVRGHADD
ncbi:hypothetical protein ACTXNK_14555 [Brachybacterium alimentarium]